MLRVGNLVRSHRFVMQAAGLDSLRIGVGPADTFARPCVSLAVNASDEQSRSLWMDTVVADAPSLTEDVRADTVVIGSGIAGLSTAYELTRRGQKVVVLDRGRIAGGMTSRTTAHLSSSSDDGFETLIRERGLEGAKTFYESHAAAIDRIEQIKDEEAIACHFRRVNGYLFPALGKDSAEELTAEFAATKKVGMAVESHAGLPFEGLQDVKCLRYPSMAAFHPLQYLRGIAAALVERGASLFANTAVTAVEEKNGDVIVRTANNGSIYAANAVVATNGPINDRVVLHTKLAPYRSYAMAITVKPDSIEDALYWDTFDPYHYVRLESEFGGTHYVIVGGADHKTGEADDAWLRFEALESWARALMPQLGDVTHRWSGQVLEPIDWAAFTGRNPGNERIYVHTGDSGQGITHGVIASLLLSRLITGEGCPWADFYDPSRVQLSAAKQFVAENITAVKNFAEYVAPGELGSIDELKPGDGAIIREGLRKVAAFRDEGNRLHRVSAACTHMGCHVHWNSLERCWDCPCHGSHFAIDGTPLNGPAVSPLEKIEPVQ
jgi:glycine/D-amino acid oxidase-like deaminating enzyme/nitrite reductase/ring-hydroxylating ferredoxin subunit